MRFGVCAGPDNLAQIARARFDFVELGVAPHLQPERMEDKVLPPLRAALDCAGLAAETFNLLLPGDWKVVGEGVDRVRLAAYLHAAFHRMATLGGQVAVFGSGGPRRITDGWPTGEAHTQILAFLALAGDAAARHGMTLAVEPLCRAECNHINTVAEAERLARELAHPAVGVLSDLYHITQDGQGYGETQDAAPRLLHVHVAGAQGRRAPTANDLDFLQRYFATLKSGGYTGRISIEANWEELPAQAGEALAVLREAWGRA